jgi:hypothetical protein
MRFKEWDNILKSLEKHNFELAEIISEQMTKHKIRKNKKLRD